MGLNLTEDQLRNVLAKWWYAEDRKNRTLDGLAKMILKKGGSIMETPKFIGKYTDNFSSKPFAYIILGAFVLVAFIAFFTPLVKIADVITRLVLIGLLVDNILRMPKKK